MGAGRPGQQNCTHLNIWGGKYFEEGKKDFMEKDYSEAGGNRKQSEKFEASKKRL